MTSGLRSNPEVSIPVAAFVGTAGTSTGYLRFVKTVCVCVGKRDSNSWLMLVLCIGNAEAGALVVTEGAQGDDTTLLSCLECVSFAEVFFYNGLSHSLIF
jgi:hypothetical protein